MPTSEAVRKRFRARLKRWQKKSKLTQPAAARRLGISQSTYEKWVQGINVPSHLTRDLLESVFALKK